MFTLGAQIRFSLDTNAGSLRNHDGDAEDNVGYKNELVFYLRISRYPRVIDFVSQCQNYLETERGTRGSVKFGI